MMGLHSHQEVLVVGNPVFMPWLTEVARDITSVRKINDLWQLVREGEQFDRIIFSRETSVSKEMIPLAAALLRNNDIERGIMVFVPNDSGWSLQNVIEFYFPDAVVREFDSTFGSLTTVELSTTISWRALYV